VIDSTKDFSVSAVDPYESSGRSQAQSTSSSSANPADRHGQGLVEGKGMLSWTLAEKKEGTTMVCGRITGSEGDSRRTKRRKGEDGNVLGEDLDGEDSESGEESEETLEVWLQLSEVSFFLLLIVWRCADGLTSNRSEMPSRKVNSSTAFDHTTTPSSSSRAKSPNSIRLLPNYKHVNPVHSHRLRICKVELRLLPLLEILSSANDHNLDNLFLLAPARPLFHSLLLLPSPIFRPRNPLPQILRRQQKIPPKIPIFSPSSLSSSAPRPRPHKTLRPLLSTFHRIRTLCRVSPSCVDSISPKLPSLCRSNNQFQLRPLVLLPRLRLVPRKHPHLP